MGARNWQQKKRVCVDLTVESSWCCYAVADAAGLGCVLHLCGTSFQQLNIITMFLLLDNTYAIGFSLQQPCNGIEIV